MTERRAWLPDYDVIVTVMFVVGGAVVGLVIVALWVMSRPAVPSAAPAKVVFTKVPWVEIYTACQGEWSVDGNKSKDGTEIRTERIKICSKVATDAVVRGIAK